MKMCRRLSLAAVTGLSLAFHGGTCLAAETVRITRDQADRLGVETTSLSETAAAVTQGYLGRVVIPPQQLRQVGSLMGGRVESVLVSPGQTVRRNQPLAAVISPDLLRLQLEYVQAISQEQYLRETLNREQALSQDRVVSPKQVLATRNELLSASATVVERRLALQLNGVPDAAIANLATTRTPSASVVVVSPVDGTVLEVGATSGQTIEGTGVLFRLAELSVLWLELQVPASQVGRVAAGGAVLIPGLRGTGTIKSIGNTVDPLSQAITVRAEFANSDAQLRPGQLVEAQLRQSSGDRSHWRLPSGAVIRMGKETYVLREVPDGYEPVPVQVQFESTNVITVSGSLSKEDKVATKGLVALKGAMRGLGGGE